MSPWHARQRSTSSVQGVARNRLQGIVAPNRLATPKEDVQADSRELEAAVSLLLTLPDGWLPGINPDAAPEAREALSTPDVLAVAHDASKADRWYRPTLTVRGLGPLEPGEDPAEALDAQEAVFREGTKLRPGVVALERVHLPAGEALRVELLDEVEDLRITQLQYYLLPTREFGYLSLWLACAERDLPESLPDFDKIARSFME